MIPRHDREREKGRVSEGGREEEEEDGPTSFPF